MGSQGAAVPTLHSPSPWYLPMASEVAPSCPPPQAPHGHPTQTPASRGTLPVPRSRFNWKRLSSTRPGWYVQGRGASGTQSWGHKALDGTCRAEGASGTQSEQQGSTCSARAQ